MPMSNNKHKFFTLHRNSFLIKGSHGYPETEFYLIFKRLTADYRKFDFGIYEVPNMRSSVLDRMSTSFRFNPFDDHHLVRELIERNLVPTLISS